jgi:hypothetical protein
MKQMSKEERNKQKAKFGALFGVGLITATLLSGCSTISSLYYQGKERQLDEVEEMLSDYLESENPNYELNVQITEDVD